MLELVSSTALLYNPKLLGASVSPFLRGPRLTRGTPGEHYWLQNLETQG